MLELILIRHPLTKGNEERVLQGHLDVDLAQGYEEKVDRIAQELSDEEPINFVLSSDLKRAKIPAERMLEFFRKYWGVEYLSTPLLRERNLGIFQGKKFEDVPTGGLGIYEYLYKLDNIDSGESHADIKSRIEKLNHEYLSTYSGKAVVVSHKLLINFIRNYFVEGNITSRPYKDIDNLAIKRILSREQEAIELI